ncbi:MAG: biotin/lipoate A/B protein ligase family protein [Hyphomicrobiaceae bacterium]
MVENESVGLAVRVIETRTRGGRANIAFDDAMIALHARGAIPDTIRFLDFTPTALVGRHQSVSREIDIDHCHRHGIEIARRITGGGAIYFDEGQLGWELVVSRRRLALPSLADYTLRICSGVAAGLSKAFGIDSRFRPRNDIEVGGRKLCGTGGFFDGETLFYQGTLLIDVDPARVMAALKVPRTKLEKRQLDRPEQRIVTLKALLGDVPPRDEIRAAIVAGLAAELGLSPKTAAVSESEEAQAARRYQAEIGTDAFVYDIDDTGGDGVLTASRTCPGGTLDVFIRLEGPSGAPRIREALLTGDFFITPPRLVLDLEASLRGVAVSEAGSAVERFFDAHRPQMLSLTPDDFGAVVEAALAMRGQ